MIRLLRLLAAEEEAVEVHCADGDGDGDAMADVSVTASDARLAGFGCAAFARKWKR